MYGKEGHMQFVTNLLPTPPSGAQNAPSPLIPAIVAGVAVIFILLYFIIKRNIRKRKLRALYLSSEIGMELDADEIKSESKAKFKQARGFVPGKMPRTSYISKDRIGAEPHEIIKVRETYHPTMELPKTVDDGKKTASKKRDNNPPSMIPKGVSPYSGALPRRSAPLDIPRTEPIKPPVLNPIPAHQEKRMPMLAENSSLAPVLLPQRPAADVQKPVLNPVRMPTPPIARRTAVLPKPLESYTHYHGMANPIPKKPTLPPAKIVDDDELAAYLATQNKGKRKKR